MSSKTRTGYSLEKTNQTYITKIYSVNGKITFSRFYPLIEYIVSARENPARIERDQDERKQK